MNRTRRTRSLTPEERKLWAHVAREIAPLKGRSLAEEPEPEPSAPAQPAAKAEPPPSAPAARLAGPPPRPPAPRPARPRLPPLAPLDRKVKTALRRGARSVNAAIDLHG